MMEKFLDKIIPTRRRARVNLRNEPENVSRNSDVARVQQAIEAAEAGNTRDLFALYRDLVISGSHVQTEFNKRKLAVLSQTYSILPADETNKDDLLAAAAVTQMIGDCENWLNGLVHLLDSTVWPVSVVEKVFRPGDAQTGPGKVKLQYTLRRLEIVNPTLLCFEQPYAAPLAARTQSPLREPVEGEQDIWEPDLRFYSTDDIGQIRWNYAESYAADRARHIIHRGHLLVSVRDNWGGPMRAVVFWWLLGSLGRDWFGRYMERYGMPYTLGKTDSTSDEAVQFLKDALSLSTKIGGLVVDHETEVELVQAMTSNGADAYDRFLSICNREISKVILGQTLSSDAQSTGLGSSVGNLQGEVREDVRSFDQRRLAETLQQQLFEPFLRINGFKGSAPRMVFGDLSAAEAKGFADLLVSLSQAGFEPTDEAIPTISERVGFQLQRKAAAPAGPMLPFSSEGARLITLSASTGDPTDQVAAKRAKALGEVYRGSMAPFRQIILSSTSREDCLKKLETFYSDWNPERLASELETALQICAAAGAALGKSES